MRRFTCLAFSAIFSLWGQFALGSGDVSERISLEPKVNSMSAGSVVFKFELKDTKTLHSISDADLAISHEKKLHLIIYDSSLNEFQHVHPEFDGKIWTTPVEFGVNGHYWVWAQGELAADGTEFSAATKINVSGGSPAWPSLPSLADVRRGSSDISEITLTSKKLTAGKMAMLDLVISRTDGSTPQLTPYLGAFAHVIATPESGDSLIHVHPIGTGATKGMLHATFPAAGTYRLWIQFIDGGHLRTVPLSLKVF